MPTLFMLDGLVPTLFMLDGLVPTLFMLISVTCPHGYLNSLDACLTKLLNMSLHSKLAFCKIYLYQALLYLEPKHGLLASTFKVLIGLPLVILLARHERTGCDEEHFGDEHAS